MGWFSLSLRSYQVGIGWGAQNIFPDTTGYRIALMHVYVRRVNFTTKSRFQNIKLRSFA